MLDAAPVFSSDPFYFDANEDAAVGAEIGTLQATDPDGDSVTFTIPSGDGTFGIDPLTGALRIDSPLDYETTSFYYFAVEASDPQGNAATAYVYLTVWDVAETPQFSNDLFYLYAPEDTAVGAVLTAAAAIDPNGDPVSQ